MSHYHIEVVVPAVSRYKARVAARCVLGLCRYPGQHWDEHYDDADCDCDETSQFYDIAVPGRCADAHDAGDEDAWVLPFTDWRASNLLRSGVVCDLLVVSESELVPLNELVRRSRHLPVSRLVPMALTLALARAAGAEDPAMLVGRLGAVDKRRVRAYGQGVDGAGPQRQEIPDAIKCQIEAAPGRWWLVSADGVL